MFLGVGRAIVSTPSPFPVGGTSSKPLSLILRDFPSTFSCSIFFFLLAPCFLFLHFQAYPTSFFDIKSRSRQERDKDVCRRKGIGGYSLCSFYYTFSEFRGIKETHNCTPYVKWGVVNPKAPLRGIFHSSPILTAGRIKNRYCCACLV